MQQPANQFGGGMPPMVDDPFGAGGEWQIRSASSSTTDAIPAAQTSSIFTTSTGRSFTKPAVFNDLNLPQQNPRRNEQNSSLPQVEKDHGTRGSVNTGEEDDLKPRIFSDDEGLI
jgi:hypothetical protein